MAPEFVKVARHEKYEGAGEAISADQDAVQEAEEPRPMDENVGGCLCDLMQQKLSYPAPERTKRQVKMMYLVT